MIIVLIHWKIKNTEDHIKKFLAEWRREFVVEDRAGLIGEFLSEVSSPDEFPYITWNIGPANGDYKDFVNVGMWADEDAFQTQIGSKFNDAKPILEYEYERRVRTVLRPKAWRLGDAHLPVHDSGGTL